MSSLGTHVSFGRNSWHSLFFLNFPKFFQEPSMTPLQSQLTYPATATAAALVGSVFDVKSRRIPNFITFPSILLGLAMHLALGGWKQLLNSLAAGLICGIVFLVFYIAGGMGAGDVKLIAAVGCIAGLSHVPYLLVL